LDVQSGYVSSESDGFTVESNAPQPEAPATAQAEPVEAAAGADEQADDAKAAKERDEQGRFKAKAAKADDATEDAEEPEQTAKAEPEPVKKAKPREDPEARISQSVARQREAERRAEAAERKAAELEARLRTPEPASKERPAAAPADRFPRFEQWMGENPDKTHDDYLDARDEHNRAKFFTEAQEHQRRYQAQRQRHELSTNFSKGLDAAVKADPEFLSSIADDVLNLPTMDSLRQGERPTAWHFIGEELLRSDNPPRLMRHWSAHPDDFQALASLPQREITRRIAKLESQLDAAPDTRSAPAAPLISQAKPPVRRVPGSPITSSTEPDPDDENLDKHIGFYNAREGRRGR
jgi:hypothetical protein